ncbi:UNVERIFIED_CONTAM: protein MRG1 [Sesamum calycinum]|uniref:Protein MRG1 n=1 Tax=Sesamum calycinum TaxID=2727403 RepID=A0AAW2JAK9_9LAMI
MDRLMKHTEENIQKQQALDKKAGVDKNTKSGRSAQTKPKGSAGQSSNREAHQDPNSTKSKKQLVDDWEFITQQNKLVKLPRSPSVDEILTKYLEYRSKKDGMFMLNNQSSFFLASYDGTEGGGKGKDN